MSIGSFFLNGITSSLEWVIGHLPAYTGLPAGLLSAFNFFNDKVAGACSLIPYVCTSTNIIINLVIAIVLGLLVFDFFAWVFHWKQAK